MEEEMIKELIENYQSNKRKFRKLQEKLIDLYDYNTKVTAAYGDNPGGGAGGVSSKVERYAVKICDTQQQLMDLANNLRIVDQAQKVLNDKENEVIEMIKLGYRNKLSKIGRLLGKDRKYIFDTRNKAIKKMSEYIISIEYL